MLDGVYERGEVGPVFVEAPASTDEDVHAALHRIVGRLLKMLTRRGTLVEEQGASRISWVRLLKRVFEIDMEHRANCGGELEVIAAILEAPVIERILEHFGLPARAPLRTPARASMLQAA